ncbi:flagellar motor switch protein FliN [Pusillimonas minor]|uniref:Flagellar motor switch protein FliN n=1 Tax=Pusillimonas minor TaxID=2697024 RepID=A0A842HLT8_9BURK|nr:flagellar motor switch protein FliN [Pusillimonas minor]MBC2768498.1 flagellar motor switch protein FliN [Pusillimonas minor]
MTDPTQDPDKENAANNGLSDQDPAQAGGLSEELDDDWAAALSEQAAASRSPTQADGLQDDMDDWAAALAEQTAATQSGVAEDQDTAGASAGNDFSSPEPAAPVATPAAQQVFQPLIGSGTGGNSDIDLIMDIPVQLSVELGRTKLTIKNILQLGQGSVVELDGLAGEPMDIFVNGYLIAQGEVVVVDDKYGIRLTDIITPSDRLHRLNSRR